MSDLKLVRLARKVFELEGIRVTEENMKTVNDWCEGEVITKDDRGEDITPFIRVRVLRPLNDRQTKAYPGDWVLYSGKGFKVYSDRALKNDFDIKQSDEDLVGSNVD